MADSRARVLVTGATGFIGGCLVRRLIKRGCEVHGVSRRKLAGRADGVHWWQGNLRDTDRIQQIVDGSQPDRIVHLASQVTGDRSLERVLPILHDNLVSSVGLLTAAARNRCQRVVLAGSMEEPDPKEGLAIPGSPYAAAKWSGSAYGRMFHALYGLPVVMARIFMVYGPGQQDIAKLVPYVIANFLRGEVPALGSGRRAIDWVYVDDVAEGLERACFAEGIGGLTLDMGSGRQNTIREVVESLAAIIRPPFAPVFGALADRPLDREPVADTGRTESLLGWRATTPLPLGLEQTVRWYREHPQIYRWDVGASGLATPAPGPAGLLRPRRGN